MREIKFRAWNNEWKRMKPVAKLTFERHIQSLMVYNDATDGYGNVSIYEKWEDCVIGDDVILMQFTGLLDKNGKEIYEGDVVEYKAYGTWHKDEVKFSNGKFHGQLSGVRDDLQSNYDLGLIETLGCEIVGNIYENPDL